MENLRGCSKWEPARSKLLIHDSRRKRYIEPAVHLHRDAATRRDLFRDLSERLTETYYRQPALVDDDDVAATQARRASSRSSTGEWDLEALGEPELARTTTPLV